jgi:hypothetical protein
VRRCPHSPYPGVVDMTRATTVRRSWHLATAMELTHHRVGHKPAVHGEVVIVDLTQEEE